MTAGAQPVTRFEMPATTRTVEGLEILLANALLVVLLFPYASPVPLPMDVQPLFIALAFSALFLLFVVRGYVWNLDRSDAMLLVIAVLYAVYVDWSTTKLDLWYFRKSAIMLLTFPAYWAVKQLYPRMSSGVVFWVGVAYLLLTLAQRFAPPLFNIYARLFIPRLANTGFGRGLTGPAPEQSFLAYLALAFPIVFILISAKDPDRDSPANKRRFRILCAISFVLVMLAGSVTGLAFGGILLVSLWLATSPTKGIMFRRATGAFLVFVVLGLIGAAFVGLRAQRLIKWALTNPSLILIDESIAARYAQITIGTYTGIVHPLGTGRSVGNTQVFEEGARGLGLDSYVPQVSMSYIRQQRLDNGDIAVLSPFADSMARMGMVFVVQLLLLIAIMRYPGASLASRLFFLMGIASSFPLSFPVFWLLLGAHEGWYFNQRRLAALGQSG
jgi:hypothetical protein